MVWFAYNCAGFAGNLWKIAVILYLHTVLGCFQFFSWSKYLKSPFSMKVQGFAELAGWRDSRLKKMNPAKKSDPGGHCPPKSFESRQNFISWRAFFFLSIFFTIREFTNLVGLKLFRTGSHLFNLLYSH